MNRYILLMAIAWAFTGFSALAFDFEESHMDRRGHGRGPGGEFSLGTVGRPTGFLGQGDYYPGKGDGCFDYSMGSELQDFRFYEQRMMDAYFEYQRAPIGSWEERRAQEDMRQFGERALSFIRDAYRLARGYTAFDLREFEDEMSRKYNQARIGSFVESVFRQAREFARDAERERMRLDENCHGGGGHFPPQPPMPPYPPMPPSPGHGEFTCSVAVRGQVFEGHGFTLGSAQADARSQCAMHLTNYECNAASVTCRGGRR